MVHIFYVCNSLEAFIAEGVQPSDIVLGLHSRSLRKFSEYAIE
jgi:hypothetical protein